MKCRKKLFVILTSVIILLVSLTPCFTCYATFYDNDYPTDIGFESGYYLRASTNLGTATFLMTQSVVDSLVLTSNKQLYNITTGNIWCTCYIGSTYYRCNWVGGETGRIQSYNGTTGYTYINIRDILDTNIDFPHINPDNPYVNNNLYFSKFEIAVVSLLVAQLFFILMGWFLLHRKL